MGNSLVELPVWLLNIWLNSHLNSVNLEFNIRHPVNMNLGYSQADIIVHHMLWWERCIAAVTKPVAERWIRRDHQPRGVSVRQFESYCRSLLGV
jgi:hypothetical protein